MKKFKNLVIGGIENKVVNLILITVVVLALAFQAAGFFQNRMLTEVSNETTAKQEEALTTITSDVMGEVVDSSMTRSTQLEALIADEVFHHLAVRVEVLGEYARTLFEDPDGNPRAEYAAPDAANDGQIVAQLILADGTDEEAIADKIGLAANMSDMMVSLFGASAETNSCFIALPEGAFLVVDDRSASKFAETGQPVIYDCRTRPWYMQAVEKGTLIFTDVEIDAFTGDIGIVCAMPVYVDGELAAVVGSDLFLTSMNTAIQDSEENGGFQCVINGNGHVVFSPKESGEFKVVESANAADLRLNSNHELASFITDAMNGVSEMRIVNLADGPYYMIACPMDTVGWTLVSAFSQGMADKPAEMLRTSYQEIQNDAAETYLAKMSKYNIAAAIGLGVLSLLALISALILGRKIVKPLNLITKRIAGISETNVEFVMEDEFRTGDEIEVLAESFARLSHRTVQYIEEVLRITVEKERIGTELQMANQIQESMLPSIFPAFPERSEFDIYATMDPAREVGGDFYDFFLIDKDHLCMVIADVSGKGVPAALFMMISKIIIQSCAMLGRGAGEILTKTNEALCSNNRMEMFVTVWLGILEISTGKLTASNAGHEYPAMKTGDKFELLKDKHGLVIGGMAGIQYKEYELQLKPGDKLFLYTDGVAEATRGGKELFGTKRMLEALNKDPEASPYELLGSVRSAVDEFVGNDEQFDDLTMMCFEYIGDNAEEVPEDDA